MITGDESERYMEQSMRILIGVLNRMIEDTKGEQPIYTSVFKIGDSFDSDKKKRRRQEKFKSIGREGLD